MSVFHPNICQEIASILKKKRRKSSPGPVIYFKHLTIPTFTYSGFYHHSLVYIFPLLLSDLCIIHVELSCSKVGSTLSCKYKSLLRQIVFIFVFSGWKMFDEEFSTTLIWRIGFWSVDSKQTSYKRILCFSTIREKIIFCVILSVWSNKQIFPLGDSFVVKYDSVICI